MSMFGGDFGLSEFIFKKLNTAKSRMSVSSQKRVSRILADSALFFSIAAPLMTLPQIVKIYSEKEASGLSGLTFGFYLFNAFFWLAYGVFIKNRPIVLANTFWIVIHISILSGIYIYG